MCLRFTDVELSSANYTKMFSGTVLREQSVNQLDMYVTVVKEEDFDLPSNIAVDSVKNGKAHTDQRQAVLQSDELQYETENNKQIVSIQQKDNQKDSVNVGIVKREYDDITDVNDTLHDEQNDSHERLYEHHIIKEELTIGPTVIQQGRVFDTAYRLVHSENHETQSSQTDALLQSMRQEAAAHASVINSS
ncbi:uncharacterized protein LOC113515273 isoform X3 [Galleria mellonella]|uniref:Uncharacterized protein LOC113515273 isoform X3 n=1 Tax=Galleria mellonella TaxID=7137 RepID=A0ABM3N0I4_GALME|nr:uncharacterized protein LOC113515273 isoform X3 [Galleria mellonella]